MENSRRFIYLGVLVIAFIMLVSFFAVDIRYISKLEHQIAQRDSLIRELSFSDELVKEYFNIEKDSIGHKTSFSLKDEKKTRIIEHIETVKESTFSLNGKDISADNGRGKLWRNKFVCCAYIRFRCGKYETYDKDVKRRSCRRKGKVFGYYILSKRHYKGIEHGNL